MYVFSLRHVLIISIYIYIEGRSTCKEAAVLRHISTIAQNLLEGFVILL